MCCFRAASVRPPGRPLSAHSAVLGFRWLQAVEHSQASKGGCTHYSVETGSEAVPPAQGRMPRKTGPEPQRQSCSRARTRSTHLPEAADGAGRRSPPEGASQAPEPTPAAATELPSRGDSRAPFICLLAPDDPAAVAAAKGGPKSSWDEGAAFQGLSSPASHTSVC